MNVCGHHFVCKFYQHTLIWGIDLQVGNTRGVYIEMNVIAFIVQGKCVRAPSYFVVVELMKGDFSHKLYTGILFAFVPITICIFWGDEKWQAEIQIKKNWRQFLFRDPQGWRLYWWLFSAQNPLRTEKVEFHVLYVTSFCDLPRFIYLVRVYKQRVLNVGRNI